MSVGAGQPVAHVRLTLIRALVTSCLIQHPLPPRFFPSMFFFLHRCAHHGVSGHDGVVAVVVQRGRHGVQGAGSVGVAADPVVLAPLGDLLAVFEPVDLRHE